MNKITTIILSGVLVGMAAQASVVLEFDANDLALTSDANATSWAPSVNSNTGSDSMNMTLGTGSSVVTPASSYFTRAVENPNVMGMKTLDAHSAASGGTHDFSFEVWVKMADLTGSHILFETGGNTIGTSITMTDNVLDFRVNNSGSAVGAASSTLAALPSDFIQVVGVLDVSDSLSLYVNGTLAQTVTGITIADWAGANEGQLGGTDVNVAKPAGFEPTVFDGQVALARFYNSALTVSEVETLYTSTIPEPATLGLVAVFGGALILIRRKFII